MIKKMNVWVGILFLGTLLVSTVNVNASGLIDTATYGDGSFQIVEGFPTGYVFTGSLLVNVWDPYVGDGVTDTEVPAGLVAEVGLNQLLYTYCLAADAANSSNILHFDLFNMEQNLGANGGSAGNYDATGFDTSASINGTITFNTTVTAGSTHYYYVIANLSPSEGTGLPFQLPKAQIGDGVTIMDDSGQEISLASELLPVLGPWNTSEAYESPTILPPVPEPGTLLLVGLGLLFGAIGRKRIRGK